MDELNRDEMEAMILRMAEDVIYRHVPFWSEHKKQSVLKYIRRWARDLTMHELTVKTGVEQPKTYDTVGNLVIEAGAGYDRYIERQEKRNR